VPAEVGADGGHGESGRGQRPAVASPAASPRGQRAEEQRGRAGLADGVHQADPLLVPVQRRPVGQAGGRRRRGAGDPRRDEYPGRALGAAEQVEQDRGSPAAKRQPDQRGVGGLAERDAVQGVRARAGRQRAYDGVGEAVDQGVEGVRTLDALGDGRRPGQQGGLAGLTRAPGRGKEGLPHVLVRTRHLRRLPAGWDMLIKIAAQKSWHRARLPAHSRAVGPTRSQHRRRLRLEGGPSDPALVSGNPHRTTPGSGNDGASVSSEQQRWSIVVVAWGEGARRAGLAGWARLVGFQGAGGRPAEGRLAPGGG